MWANVEMGNGRYACVTAEDKKGADMMANNFIGQHWGDYSGYLSRNTLPSWLTFLRLHARYNTVQITEHIYPLASQW
jgi:hypothetical protein